MTPSRSRGRSIRPIASLPKIAAVCIAEVDNGKRIQKFRLTLDALR